MVSQPLAASTGPTAWARSQKCDVDDLGGMACPAGEYRGRSPVVPIQEPEPRINTSDAQRWPRVGLASLEGRSELGDIPRANPGLERREPARLLESRETGGIGKHGHVDVRDWHVSPPALPAGDLWRQADVRDERALVSEEPIRDRVLPDERVMNCGRHERSVPPRRSQAEVRERAKPWTTSP